MRCEASPCATRPRFPGTRWGWIWWWRAPACSAPAPRPRPTWTAGAKRVIITAPGKEVDLTVVLGVNHSDYRKKKHYIVSNASCTTNCLAPPAMVVHKAFGIVKGLMTTVHSYTNDQRILDLPHKDLRRARAAAVNMIPTSTGAARALGLVIPELAGRFDGCSVRVPTPTVSLVDFTAMLAKPTDTDTLRKALKEGGRSARFKGIMAVDHGHLVSMDLKGDPTPRWWTWSSPRCWTETWPRWWPGMTTSGATPAGSAIWPPLWPRRASKPNRAQRHIRRPPLRGPLFLCPLPKKSPLPVDTRPSTGIMVPNYLIVSWINRVA